MNFSENFIKKPVMTTLVMVVVLIFGIAAYFKLPISDLPVVDYPVITVSVAYPGASPNTMAMTVASPLENQFTQIPGLNTIISTNTEGQTSIMLTFELSRSVDLAAPDVQAAIQRATGNLPTDLPAPPSYSKTNPSDTPVMYFLVNSDTLTPGQLFDFGNRTIGQRLSMVQDVSQVQTWGAKTAVRVQVDPNKMSAYQLGMAEVANSVNNGTVTVPGGSLNGDVRTFSIEPKGQLFKAKDYENVIVAYRNNAPIRLKDIGRCIDSVDNDVMNVDYGKAKEGVRGGTVVVAVSRVAGANTVALAQRLRDTVAQLQKEIPGSVKLDIFYDKSITIVESVNDVKLTIIIALILVILIIYLFLGSLSDTIIPSITLPLSIVATFILMYALHFSLDNLSLMGLTLSVGFVVDDAIVVLENTVRLIEKGMKPLAAAIESAKEITFTIISMTLSLTIIFVPLVFMGGTVGRVFQEFAITVILAILCSGVISLTLSPMMCARMLKEKGKEKEKALQKHMNKFMKGVIDTYGVWLTWTLKRPMTTLIAWIFCFVGTIVFFFVLPQSFLPEGDSGFITGGILVPLGTSTTKVRNYQDAIDRVVIEDKIVDRFLTVTGLNPGADQSTGFFVCVLKPLDERKMSIQDFTKKLRAKLGRIPNGFVFLEPVPTLKISAGAESTASGAKYSYVLTGPDQTQLYKTALDFEKTMRGLAGIRDVQNSVKLNMPQLNIKINRDRASTFGITAQDIENALALSYAQGKVTTFKTDVDIYNVIVELDKKFQKNPENLSHIYLHSTQVASLVPHGSKGGSLVPLSAIASWEQGVGPQNVPHYNQLNSATLSFNVDPGVPIGNATKLLQDSAAKAFPPGVTGFFQGEAQQFQEAVASLGILIIIAVFLKYIVLGVLYENYVHPLTILTTLPVATFGGLLTLFLFGSELSLYGYVGMFMLLGIVAKNGIMMVDFANANLNKGNVSDFDAIYDACIVRFRPILMTGLAAIMGAVPIALGFGADGSSRRPLGLIVVGGLIFSQVITLFVTPGLFLYMQKFQSQVLDKFELTRSEAARKRMESVE
ncbi:MAG: efflux RND transporter permease subunit [Candidatus Omnitrophica bacterium]|nr:efflux RND transporter permease subunit [Candidatus Omnitrophota bacterium]